MQISMFDGVKPFKIVVTVLMAIFGQMLNIDWQEKVKELVGEIVDV